MYDWKYNVRYGLGFVNVIVRQSAIRLRGEREAVAQAAWYHLLGKNELGEDVNKKLSTRAFIMAELDSRVESERPAVFEGFKEAIKFTKIDIVR